MYKNIENHMDVQIPLQEIICSLKNLSCKQSQEDGINVEELISFIKNKYQMFYLKKYITVKEFTEIYNISKTSQQNYRSRLYDPLPYHQKVVNGKIFYDVKAVEQWLKNQYR